MIPHVRRRFVAAPGSPPASAGSGNGAPSVWATSYLGIPQPGHGNAALVAEGALAWPEFEVPVATRFEQDTRVCSRNVGRLWKSEPSGKPSGVNQDRRSKDK